MQALFNFVGLAYAPVDRKWGPNVWLPKFLASLQEAHSTLTTCRCCKSSQKVAGDLLTPIHEGNRTFVHVLQGAQAGAPLEMGPTFWKGQSGEQGCVPAGPTIFSRSGQPAFPPAGQRVLRFPPADALEGTTALRPPPPISLSFPPSPHGCWVD